ncbi:hypothetical protein [Psychromonas sp. Urea-02u-13]|uniref:hypothetical protein n=1 Tax=Psychromonas sp. Urea-02u-13 TaxID=2058326 RepID=UPI000C327AEF|nr:hypothetical protein [Psychromonas sp. Urea-02u-13]PKG37222.1 hypothetical protein CXF74_19990 [Psychromonas sp. Urea-02u-13]
MRRNLILLWLLSLVSTKVFSGPPSPVPEPQADIPKVSVGGNGRIYTNGNMQLEVTIDVVLYDNPKVNWVKLYTNDTRNPQLLENVEGWKVSETENEYLHYIPSGTLAYQEEPQNSEDTRYKRWVTSNSPDHEEICASINLTRSDNGEIEEITSCRKTSSMSSVHIVSLPPVFYSGNDFELGDKYTSAKNSHGIQYFENLKRRPYVPEILHVEFANDDYKEETYQLDSKRAFSTHFYGVDSVSINQAMTFALEDEHHKNMKLIEPFSKTVTTTPIEYSEGTATNPLVILSFKTFHHKSKHLWNVDTTKAGSDESCDITSGNDGSFVYKCYDYNGDTKTLSHNTYALQEYSKAVNAVTVTDHFGTKSIIFLSTSSARLFIQ